MAKRKKRAATSRSSRKKRAPLKRRTAAKRRKTAKRRTATKRRTSAKGTVGCEVGERLQGVQVLPAKPE